MLESKSLEILLEAVGQLEKGFDNLPSFANDLDLGATRKTILEVVEKLRDNYPYFHPLYAGQMLKPPHPIARLAYMLAMWINPNNHALDGGKASSAMEKKAVSDIAAMFGWQNYLGHLTGGGTMANLEALWVAGRINPDKKIVASSQAHYTHGRISEVLKLGFETVPCDTIARMDVTTLEEMLEAGDIGTVVVTVGTTGVGSIDPLADILRLKERYGFRVHIDSAYGGYFTLAGNLSDHGRQVFDLFHEADSIVVDPHKHGLQPYGCGCVLFKDPDAGRFYKHDSPYTYFSSSDLHLGEISLECSRAGASAVALWATQKMFPMKPGSVFAGDLSKSRGAALDLYSRIERDTRFLTLMKPELDIVVWAIKRQKASQISAASELLFELAAEKDLHLAVFDYPCSQLTEKWPDVDMDQDSVSCLRSCLMKPEHQDWMDKIWQIIDQTVDEL